jgi:hypothetical protein
MTGAGVKSKKLRTRVKEIDELRKQEPMNANSIFTFVNYDVPIIAARQRTIPAK